MKLDLPVLVPGRDHDYREVNLQKYKAVWNSKYWTWGEYYEGIELESGDEVVDVYICD